MLGKVAFLRPADLDQSPQGGDVLSNLAEPINRSPSDWFASMINRAVDYERESTKDYNALVKSTAGAGMGLFNLLGSIPVGIGEWATQVVEKIPKGPGPTIHKFFEVPISGMFRGASYVFDKAQGWVSGRFYNMDRFDIAYEVTAALGTAVLIVFGSKGIISGGGKLVSTAKAAATDIAEGAELQGAAVVTAGGGAVPLAGWKAIAVSGGVDLIGGGMLATSTGDGIKESSAGSSTVESMRIKGKRGPPPRVSNETLVAALEKHNGNRTEAAKKVGLSIGVVSKRIIESGAESPLAKFKGIKGKQGSPPKINDKDLAEVLKNHNGSRTGAAEEVELTRQAVSDRIIRSGAESPLAKFRQ